MDPLRHFPVLYESIVELFDRNVGFPGFFLFNQSNSAVSIFPLIPLLIHLLENRVLLVRSSDNLIQLLISIDFICLIFWIISDCLSLTLSIRQQVLELLLAILVRSLVVEHTGLDDDVVKIFFLLCLVQNAFLNSRNGDQSVHTDL